MKTSEIINQIIEDTIFCASCHQRIDADDNEYEDANGNAVCRSCFNECYYECDHCGDVTPRDEIITIDGGREYVCESCANSHYYQCDECCEYVSRRNLWTDGNMTICTNCSDNYCTCADCDDVIRSDDGHYIQGYYYCDNCASSHRTVINDYDYKPTPIFYGDTRTHYGLEVEIDDGDDRPLGHYGLEVEIDDGYDTLDAAQAIQDAGGNCIYLKHDGSLSSDGFEIVTHPATLEYHMQSFPWRSIISTALDYNYTSHDAGTCGLHIHASRTLFGNDRTIQDLNIAKTILLIDFWWNQYIVPFSRRDYNQLNEWAKKPNACILPTDNEYEASSKARQCGEYDRYKAVNLKNRNTVEFRFFRGTLRRNTILASIQFVDTLINYVSGVKLEELWDKTWSDVFGDTQYTELKEYLQKRKLLDESEEI